MEERFRMKRLVFFLLFAFFAIDIVCADNMEESCVYLYFQAFNMNDLDEAHNVDIILNGITVHPEAQLTKYLVDPDPNYSIRITAKARDKFKKIYDDKLLLDLYVSNNLPSGKSLYYILTAMTTLRPMKGGEIAKHVTGNAIHTVDLRSNATISDNNVSDDSDISAQQGNGMLLSKELQNTNPDDKDENAILASTSVKPVTSEVSDEAKQTFNIGKSYYVSGKYKKAVEYLERARQLGYYEANAYLHECYCEGYGVQKNMVSAMYYLREGVEHGNANCINSLGVCYERGNGVGQDNAEAFRLYKQAAELGLPLAQRNVGLCYEMGRGVTMDKQKAAIWYLLSSYYGDSRAKQNYTQLNAEGYYVNLNDALALIPSNDGIVPDSYEPGPTPSRQSTTQNTTIVSSGSNGKTSATVSDVDISIPHVNTISDNTFAVIIANEEYMNISNVDYAINDGNVFAKYCHETLGLPDNNILTYNNATYGIIEKAISKIEKIGNAYEGDINIIFYYAGHGIPDEKTLESYIIPVDGDGSTLSICVKTSDLYKRLSAINAKSTIVFMDACFSGSVRGNGMLMAARGVAVKVKDSAVTGNIIVLSAAQGDETAYPLPEQGHGMFTYYLLKKLQETSGRVSMGELADYVIKEVKKKSIIVNDKIQTPTAVAAPQAGNWRNWQLLK